MTADRGLSALVVHSPLVGPATVQPLAARLTARGWRAIAPDLRQSAVTPAAFAAAAIGATGAADVVIGHSGAGAMLPVVSDGVGASLTVFVDAMLPEPTRHFRLSAQLLEHIDALPLVAGRLPPWNAWWPPETMRQLVPDDAMRAALEAELPRLPRAFYDDEVELPEAWWERGGAYLQLSPAYEADRERAEALAWPAQRWNGHHLELVVRPDDVAQAVSELVQRAAPLRWRPS